MEQRDFDDILGLARQAGHLLKIVFEDLAEEELSLESAIKHYPLIAVSVAVGAGAAAGWWAANRRRPALPPPQESPPETPRSPTYFEQILPAVEKMRKAVPESMTDEAAAMARNWMDTVLEPKLRQGMDNISTNMGESKWGSFFKQAVQRMDSEDDIRLDDPEESDPPTGTSS